MKKICNNIQKYARRKEKKGGKIWRIAISGNTQKYAIFRNI